jgi:hypothetical protein
VLGEAVTGSEIPNLIAPLKAPEAPGEEKNTKWKRLFNAVATAQNRQQDGRPLVRLILAVMNPVRFSSQVRYDECRAYRSRLRTEASGAGQQRRGVGAGIGLVGELAVPDLMERPAAELGELVLRRVRVGQAPGGLLEDLGRAAVGQAGAMGDRAQVERGDRPSRGAGKERVIRGEVGESSR